MEKMNNIPNEAVPDITFKNHRGAVYHLSKLNDGRLISCGGDGLLNI